MKKKLKAMLLAVSISIPALSVAQIPTTDGLAISSNQIITQMASEAEIAELLKQYEKLQEMYKTSVDQLNQAKQEADNMKRRMEGISNYAKMLKDGDLDVDLKGLLDTLANVDAGEFMSGLGFQMPEANETNVGYHSQVEVLAKEDRAYDELLSKYKEQEERVKKLREEASLADTPQKREELQNTIAIEAMEQQRQESAYKAQIEKNKIHEEARRKADRAEFIEEQFALPSWMEK